MKNPFSQSCSSTVIVLALALQFVLFSSIGQAQWHSQADKLPGMDVDVGKILLIAAGVTAVVVVTILVIKSSHKDEIKEDTLKTDSTSKSSSLWNYKNTDYSIERYVVQHTAIVENKVPVAFLYDARRRAFSVGLSLTF